jgi:hypothetical protein
MTFEEALMIEQRNHDIAVPQYYEAFGIGCDFVDRRGTDDDKLHAIDWIINGFIRSGTVQEKSHNANFLGYLTGTFNVREYDRCTADYLTNIYVNEDTTAVEAFMVFRTRLYKDVCEKFPFASPGNSLIELTGKDKGQIKMAHPFIKGASATERKARNRQFIAIPLVYWLDCPDFQNALVHLWLSERAQRILALQKLFYRNFKTPRCEDMLKWGIING